MASLKASVAGRQKIVARRQELGWKYRDERWAIAAGQILLPNLDWSMVENPYMGISETTMHRFQARQCIRPESFVALSSALGLTATELVDRSEGLLPCTLPRAEIFWGREQEQQEISDWLQNSLTFLNLWGAPGIGKSALAAEVVIRNQQFFEAIIWRSIDERVYDLPLKDFIEDILNAFPDSPRSSDYHRDFYQLLFDHRLLMIIDGHFNSEYRNWFSQLTKPQRQSCILVISEPDLQLVFGQQQRLKKLQLGGLDVTAVSQLWQQLTQRDTLGLDDALKILTKRYDGNPWMLHQSIDYILRHQCGNLPKAMELTLAMLRPVEDLLEKRVHSRSQADRCILQAIARVDDEVSFADICRLTAKLAPEIKLIDPQVALDDLCKSTLVHCSSDGEQTLYSISSVLRKYLRQRRDI
jgi:NB-ARC domain